MRKMLIAVLTLLLTATLLTTTATAQEKEVVVSIPDENLAAAIRETLGLPPGAAITSDALRNLTRLNAGGRGIADLTGMEYAVNLTGLFLGRIDVDNEWHQNPISDVSPLAALTQLEELRLDGTDVSDISALASLTQLEYLSLESTAVSDVGALASLTQLGWLDLGETGVSDISPLATLTQLRGLQLNSTGVLDVSALANLTQLRGLQLNSTGVLDVSALASLTQLGWLDLGETGVSDISPLATLTQLQDLHLNYTYVSDISPLAALTQLKYLSLKSTAVSDVGALAALTQLEYLSLESTAVSDVGALAALKHLNVLILSYTGVLDVGVLANLTQLRELSLHSTGVLDVSALASLTQLGWLDLGETGVSDVSVLASLTQLRSLNLAGTGVLDVSVLASLTQLEGLDLGETSVSDVSLLANLTQLEWLRLQNSPLNAVAYQTHIPAIQANGTEVLFLPFNPIQSVLPRAPWLVSLIYSRPSDSPVRPNVDTEIDVLIKEVQRFYADEMERHGFGRKTFQFETDANGNAVVHHVIEGDIGNLYIRKRSIIVVMSEVMGAIACGVAFVPSYDGGFASISCWDWHTLAHELGHIFGMGHDFRSDTYIMSYGGASREELSSCFAEWLDIHPAFNPNQTYRNLHAKIEMLSATLASPPNALRIRFAITAPAESLYQAQLLTPAKTIGGGNNANTGGLIGCKRLHGNPTRSTVEFVTTALTPDTKEVTLSVISIDGRGAGEENFPLDVASLLPSAKVVSIPDANLAAAVREALGFSSSEALTTHAMLELYQLDAPSRGIKDLTGLENAINLRGLNLQGNVISDFSPIAKLLKLKDLYFDAPSGLVDVSALASLAQLRSLGLGGPGVSDVSALAPFTQLERLYLNDTAVSDVSPLLRVQENLGLLSLFGCPLSYSSIHTHIPALQAKGIEVEFDNVAHPALLKNSGNRQEGEPGATLKTPFVVEAMDEHGEPIVGKTVQFDILSGSGTLSAQTATTDAQGTAQVTLTLGAAAGINKVKVSSEGIQSWVLFTAAATEEMPQPVADVNGDGSVNIQDLVLVSGQLGKTGKNSADVNGDGVVNIQDLVLVAGAFGEGAAAPSARAVSLSRLTASDVEGWLIEARAVSSVGQDLPLLPSSSPQTHLLSDSGSGEPELQIGSASRTGSPTYLRGIAVLEQLLASLMPKATALLANYPNPFNPETWIPYQLANPAEVTVTIYAANGAVVRTLDFGHRRAGSYASRSRAAYWDGRNAQGEPVASGVYFYTLTAGDFAATRKMLILK